MHNHLSMVYFNSAKFSWCSRICLNTSYFSNWRQCQNCNVERGLFSKTTSVCCAISASNPGTKSAKYFTKKISALTSMTVLQRRKGPLFKNHKCLLCNKCIKIMVPNLQNIWQKKIAFWRGKFGLENWDICYLHSNTSLPVA